MRFVDLEKPDFAGKAALVQESGRGPKERLVPLLLDEVGDADAPACATVWKAGERVGLVTSGGFGYAIGRSIALAYLRRDLAAIGTRLEVEILGERRRATVASEPIYDPTNARPRM
jgi:dimethylglycine dehydrogenase